MASTFGDFFGTFQDFLSYVVTTLVIVTIHISRFTASSNLGAAGSGSKNYAYLYIYVGNRKLGNGFQRSKGS